MILTSEFTKKDVDVYRSRNSIPIISQSSDSAREPGTILPTLDRNRQSHAFFCELETSKTSEGSSTRSRSPASWPRLASHKHQKSECGVTSLAAASAFHHRHSPITPHQQPVRPSSWTWLALVSPNSHKSKLDTFRFAGFTMVPAAEFRARTWRAPCSSSTTRPGGGRPRVFPRLS